MSTTHSQHLLRHCEPLVAISSAHLTAATRRRLCDDQLPMVTYPNAYGGFVYAGDAGEPLPHEPELATLIKAAQDTGIVWIKFDADAQVAEGFEVFDEQENPS